MDDATVYETEQIIINGTGLPPFNSTIYPQVNFCHLVACNCGDTVNFTKSLYPYYMGWGGPYLENQALLVYTCFTRTSDRAKNAELIWEKLALGWSIRATRNWIRDFWLPDHASEIQMSTDGGDDPIWRNPTISDFNLICGEDGGAMRLKSVYTGTHSLPVGWHRSL